MWLRDPKTKKKSITTTMVALWTAVSCGTLLSEIISYHDKSHLTYLSFATLALSLGLHLAKTIKVSKEGIEIDKPDETESILGNQLSKD